jgi:hypothetical protein
MIIAEMIDQLKIYRHHQYEYQLMRKPNVNLLQNYFRFSYVPHRGAECMMGMEHGHGRQPLVDRVGAPRRRHYALPQQPPPRAGDALVQHPQQRPAPLLGAVACCAGHM